MNQHEHPFAEYVRYLGKGKNGARPLTLEESQQAFAMILADQALPMQVGAFLMLMRLKEESPPELAGFVRATQNALPRQHATERLIPRVDWPAYAGKRRHLPWFTLSALLLAAHNIPVLMHGVRHFGFAESRVFAVHALEHLGITVSQTYEQAYEQLKKHQFAYLDLQTISSKLYALFMLKPVLGLRSPVHSLARMINPLGAETSMIGIFHPSYRLLHQQTADLLENYQCVVFKGDSGEAEIRPDTASDISRVRAGQVEEQPFSAMYTRRFVKDAKMDLADLRQAWQGVGEHPYGEAATIASAAMALYALGQADSPEMALPLAKSLWQSRRKDWLDQFAAVG